jgi:hypothetical protein
LSPHPSQVQVPSSVELRQWPYIPEAKKKSVAPAQSFGSLVASSSLPSSSSSSSSWRRKVNNQPIHPSLSPYLSTCTFRLGSCQPPAAGRHHALHFCLQILFCNCKGAWRRLYQEPSTPLLAVVPRFRAKNFFLMPNCTFSRP